MDPLKPTRNLFPPLLVWHSLRHCLVRRVVVFWTVVEGFVLDAFVIVLLSLIYDLNGC